MVRTSQTTDSGKSGANVVAAMVIVFVFGFCLCYFFLVFPKEQQIRRQSQLLAEREQLTTQQLEQLQLLTRMSESQLVEWVARHRQASEQFAEVMADLTRREERSAVHSVWLAAIAAGAVILGLVVAAWLIRDANADAATTLRNIANSAPTELVKACIVEELQRSGRLTEQSAAGRGVPEAVIEAGDMTGVVSRFNERKGFGFIVPDNGDKDVFFHISGVVREHRDRIAQGVRLRYRPREGTKGTEAVNIELA